MLCHIWGANITFCKSTQKANCAHQKNYNFTQKQISKRKTALVAYYMSSLAKKFFFPHERDPR